MGKASKNVEKVPKRKLYIGGPGVPMVSKSPVTMFQPKLGERVEWEINLDTVATTLDERIQLRIQSAGHLVSVLANTRLRYARDSISWLSQNALDLVFPPSVKLSQAEIEHWAALLGTFVGQVIILTCGGSWEGADTGPVALSLPSGRAISPEQHVLAFLRKKQVPSMVDYFDEICSTEGVLPV